MSRQVELDRLHGDIVSLQSPFTGILVLFKTLQIARQPIIFLAIRIRTLLQILMPSGMTLARDADALDLFEW